MSSHSTRNPAYVMGGTLLQCEQSTRMWWRGASALAKPSTRFAGADPLGKGNRPKIVTFMWY